MEGTQRDPAGTVTVGGAVSYAGDYLSNLNYGPTHRLVDDGGTEAGAIPVMPSARPAAIAEVRAAYQASSTVALAIGLEGGTTLDRPSSGGFFLVRGHIRISPATDHFALLLGAGGGALISSSTSILGFGDIDLGLRLGTRLYRDILEGSLSQTLATSVYAGQVTGHSLTTASLFVRPISRLMLGLHMTMIYSGYSTRPGFMPGLTVRFAVDGPSPSAASTAPDE